MFTVVTLPPREFISLVTKVACRGGKTGAVAASVRLDGSSVVVAPEGKDACNVLCWSNTASNGNCEESVAPADVSRWLVCP
jgi:hypothetical protein